MTGQHLERSSYLNTSHICLSSVRTSELEHEPLCDSFYREADAPAWSWYMEECYRTGDAVHLSDSNNYLSSIKHLCLSFPQVKQAVLAALDCGYRHIDCAAAYSNEEEVGQALALRVGPGKVRQSDPYSDPALVYLRFLA